MTMIAISKNHSTPYAHKLESSLFPSPFQSNRFFLLTLLIMFVFNFFESLKGDEIVLAYNEYAMTIYTNIIKTDGPFDD